MPKKGEKRSSKNLPQKSGVSTQISGVSIDLDLGEMNKPLEKLIGTVGEGAGILYEPERIRRKAEAEADAARTMARAQVDVNRILAEGQWNLEDAMALRASARINSRELRRQENIESIVAQAAHQLPESVSEEEVDEDWVAQFFNYAQDVGNEEMQRLWAKILSGEVAKPGAFSLRTLQVVRGLDQHDAMLFEYLCNYLWGWEGGALIHFYNQQTDDLLTRKGVLNHIYFLHLRSLGLIFMEPGFSMTLVKGEIEVNYSGIRHRLICSVDTNLMNTRILSDIGMQLAPLCDTKPDEEYRTLIVEEWIKRGIEVQILESEG